MKKALIFVLLLFIISLTGCSNQKTETQTPYKPTGEGTADIPYEIKTIEDLQYIDKDLTSHYILMNNIDLAGIKWKPIGSGYGSEFTGSFDGNGYNIKNLSITDFGYYEVQYYGLFGKNSGIIKNLGLDNVCIELGLSHIVGTIAGINYGYIETSYSSGSINEERVAGGKIGGLVGSNSGVIKNSFSFVNIHTTISDFSTTYDNIYTTDEVELYFRGAITGGITGENNGSVIECYSAGSIKGYNRAVGGLVGSNDFKAIENNFSTSNIDGRITGGIVADSNFVYVINNYEYKGQMIGYSSKRKYTENIGLDELHSKQWYQEVLNWDDNIWDLDVVSRGYYPIHKNSQAPLIPLPTNYPIGSLGNPVRIYTVEDLINMKNSSSIHYHYELMNNIDLNGVEWVPLGTKEEPFKGDINGNGYIINNLTVSGDYEYSGLFGYYFGTINDIKLNNVNITVTRSEASYAGGLAGFFNSPLSNINNCNVDNLSIEFTNSEETYQGTLAGNES